MKTFRLLSALLVIAMLLAACAPAATPAPTQAPVQTEPPASATEAPQAVDTSDLEIGYVLHILNTFTQVIKQGAEDAGRDLGVNVEVTGPASASSTEAIAMFEGMIQLKKDGLVTVPQPGDVWMAPIQEAVDAGIPVMTANVTAPGSAAAAWFGQNEYNSGVLLGQELRKILEADGVTEGKIVVGTCVPGIDVLVDRYDGFVKGMEGSAFSISEAYDVTPENTSNYAAWENLAGANPDMVAGVGLCSIDVPNLAQIKTRAGAEWAIGGYDLNVETLDAIKAGTAQVTVGQSPYLQGYLPVLALVQHLRDGKPLVEGWVDVGTEVVTGANVDELYEREKDPAVTTSWYADWIAQNFSDLNALAQPLPGSEEAEEPAPVGIAEPKIGYVLHILNTFTQVIKQGAEDAGNDLGVEVEVTGPASASSTEAIAMFEGMIQLKKDGLVTVPQPGDVWMAPIKEAVDAGIPVMTANVTAPGSAAAAWFGQNEYNSGVLLGQELRKILEADGVTEGKIVVGTCVPGIDVLVDRYDGFVKGMEGSAFSISEAYDVTPENTSNYAAWENLAGANPDMVAGVGLCSIDVPNLAQIKTRAGAEWAIGGYDLNVETLDAIKAGTAQVTVGQSPYLQGYLPVLALVQHLRDGKPLVEGWVDVGTEVVTGANVDELYEREKDPAVTTSWYADWIAQNFSDLNALAQPLP